MTERSSKLKWSPEEDKIIVDHWHTDKPIRMWVDLLPGRSEIAINKRAIVLQLGQRGHLTKRGNSPAWRVIRKLLESGEMLSPIEIEKRTGISRRHVYNEMRLHHSAEVHVGGYGERGKGGYRPKLWKLGPGEDAAWPEPMTMTERNRRYRINVKKNPEAMARAEAKRALRDCERAGKLIRRDEAAAWLTGVQA
ncbi:MAG: hypothetical protein AAFO57_00320 [Pseudomonadota bacterium]